MFGNVLGLLLLLSIAANASSVSELKQVQDSEQLARFIYRMLTQAVSLEELLNGIRSTEKLRIPSYTTDIPVREVYGTIVSERFEAELGADFYERKKYDVRGICAFRDAKDEVWRFHITVFDGRQYRLMEQFLKRKVDRPKRGK